MLFLSIIFSLSSFPDSWHRPSRYSNQRLPICSFICWHWPSSKFHSQWVIYIKFSFASIFFNMFLTLNMYFTRLVIGNATRCRTTYVHCKAGRGRSTTIVLCYLVSGNTYFFLHRFKLLLEVVNMGSLGNGSKSIMVKGVICCYPENFLSNFLSNIFYKVSVKYYYL